MGTVGGKGSSLSGASPWFYTTLPGRPEPHSSLPAYLLGETNEKVKIAHRSPVPPPFRHCHESYQKLSKTNKLQDLSSSPNGRRGEESFTKEWFIY
jgi:hypothetical protein